MKLKRSFFIVTLALTLGSSLFLTCCDGQKGIARENSSLKNITHVKSNILGYDLPTSVTVTVSYPGIEAKTINDEVAQLIKQNINDIEELIDIKSTSSPSGIAIITLTFAKNMDNDFALVKVLNKIASLQESLPTSLKNVRINIGKTVYLFKIISVSPTVPELSQADVINFVYYTIRDPMRRVPGVGYALLVGTGNIVYITLDPKKMAEYQLSTRDVHAVIQAQNPQGTIKKQYDEDEQEIYVTITAQSKLQTVEQFLDILVKVNNDGTKILLSDVAIVELEASDDDLISCHNRLPSAGLAVYIDSKQNQLKASAAINAEVKELSDNYPNYRIVVEQNCIPKLTE